MAKNIFVWVTETQHDKICYGLDFLNLYKILRHIYTNFSNISHFRKC